MTEVIIMYELTPEEKDKIRAEMDYRAALARHLEPLQAVETLTPWGHFKRGLSGAWTALNQPVVITLIGGLLLALFNLPVTSA